MLARQRANRIHDQLSGPVVGDVTPAIDTHQIGADFGGVALQICRKISRRPIGKHVMMFEHQQIVVY